MHNWDEYDLTLPAFWAPYLVNGDASGMDDDDVATCDAFLARTFGRKAHVCADVDLEDVYFSWRCDVPGHPGSDVADYVFLAEPDGGH